MPILGPLYIRKSPVSSVCWTSFKPAFLIRFSEGFFIYVAINALLVVFPVDAIAGMNECGSFNLMFRLTKSMIKMVGCKG